MFSSFSFEVGEVRADKKDIPVFSSSAEIVRAGVPWPLHLWHLQHQDQHKKKKGCSELTAYVSELSSHIMNDLLHLVSLFVSFQCTNAAFNYQ